MTTVRNTAREYLRVSKDRSGRERSPAEQHADHQRAAETHGWTLGPAYSEVGSASRHARKRRDGFERLCADLGAGRFGAQVLMVWESSRGSRRVSEWVNLIDLCERAGVSIHVTSDSRSYDPADARDRRTLLEDAVDAEYESEKIRKRVKRAHAANAADGKPHGPVPYGYRRTYDPATGRMLTQEPDPAEAPIIRELFRRLHKGHSLRAIAADLDRRGVRTRTGKVFLPQHLRILAVTHTYAGIRVHDPGRTAGHRLSDRAQFIPAQWKPIVDRALFLAVQRRLTAPERVVTRPGRAVHLLSMIAACDVCGGPLSARLRKDEHPAQLVYVCHRSGHVRVPYEDLNNLAEEVLWAYLARPDNIDRLRAAGADDGELATVRTAVAEIRAELDDLAAQVGAGRLSATLAARAEPAILARLRAAEQREAELARPSVLNGLISPGKDVRRRWRAAPMSARREVARLLLAPEILGELRVTRAPSPGHRGPITGRVTWRRASTAG